MLPTCIVVPRNLFPWIHIKIANSKIPAEWVFKHGTGGKQACLDKSRPVKSLEHLWKEFCPEQSAIKNAFCSCQSFVSISHPLNYWAFFVVPMDDEYLVTSQWMVFSFCYAVCAHDALVPNVLFAPKDRRLFGQTMTERKKDAFWLGDFTVNAKVRYWAMILCLF